jgi:hypothetical protein
LGVDVGFDRPTGYINEEFARAKGLVEPHQRIHPNVHGLLVIPDDDNNRFPLIRIEATVRADPDQFSNALIELAAQIPIKLSPAEEGARVLNLALINPEPLAQVTLALSAIEALGQSESWTPQQHNLIESLAVQVESGGSVSNVEQREVADAIRRSLHKIGLRQGVTRVLKRLQMQHLRNEWDRIYGLRSGEIHGTKRLTQSELAQLAFDAVTLCGKIVLAAAKRDGVVLPRIASTHFPEERQS